MGSKTPRSISIWFVCRTAWPASVCSILDVPMAVIRLPARSAVLPSLVSTISRRHATKVGTTLNSLEPPLVVRQRMCTATLSTSLRVRPNHSTECCISTCCTTSSVPPEAQALRSLLKPGGTLHLKTRVSSPLPTRANHLLPLSMWSRLPATLEVVEHGLEGDPTCYYVPSVSGVVSLLRQGGFADVECVAVKLDRAWYVAKAL